MHFQRRKITIFIIFRLLLILLILTSFIVIVVVLIFYNLFSIGLMFTLSNLFCLTQIIQYYIFGSRYKDEVL